MDYCECCGIDVDWDEELIEVWTGDGEMYVCIWCCEDECYYDCDPFYY